MSDYPNSPDLQDLDKVVVPDSADFAEEIRLLIHLAQEFPDDIELELYEPASEDMIKEFEEKNNIKLPDHLRKFYLFANGMTLSAGNLDLFPLSDIEDNLDTEWEWGDEKNYILLGDMVGDGETIFLDLDTGNIVTDDHGDESIHEDITALLFETIAIFLDGEFEDDMLDEYLSEPEE